MYKFDDAKHIHSFNGEPLIGTTTALDVLGKTLTYWASGMACAEFGWINPKLSTNEKIRESATAGARTLMEIFKGDNWLDEYIALLAKAYKAHSVRKTEARDKGVDLHALIEDYIKASIEGRAILVHEKVAPFDVWAKKNVKKFLFSEKNCYSETLWVGGQADFGYEDLQGKKVLGDVKSAKDAFFSNWVQLGAYSLQIEENGLFTAEGEPFLKPMTFDYHMVWANGTSKPCYNHNIGSTRKAFPFLLGLYKEKKRFEEGQ